MAYTVMAYTLWPIQLWPIQLWPRYGETAAQTTETRRVKDVEREVAFNIFVIDTHYFFNRSVIATATSEVELVYGRSFARNAKRSGRVFFVIRAFDRCARVPDSKQFLIDFYSATN